MSVSYITSNPAEKFTDPRNFFEIGLVSSVTYIALEAIALMRNTSITQLEGQENSPWAGVIACGSVLAYIAAAPFAVAELAVRVFLVGVGLGLSCLNMSGEFGKDPLTNLLIYGAKMNAVSLLGFAESLKHDKTSKLILDLREFYARFGNPQKNPPVLKWDAITDCFKEGWLGRINGAIFG